MAHVTTEFGAGKRNEPPFVFSLLGTGTSTVRMLFNVWGALSEEGQLHDAPTPPVDPRRRSRGRRFRAPRCRPSTSTARVASNGTAHPGASSLEHP